MNQKQKLLIMSRTILGFLALQIVLVNGFTLHHFKDMATLLQFGSQSDSLELPRDDSNDLNTKNVVVSAYFAEQCAMECMKNLHCASYVFYFNLNSCVMRIDAKFNLLENRSSELVANVSEKVACDLTKCAKAVYCSAIKKEDESEKCLCDMTTTSGSMCMEPVKYALSEWSEWSPCSTTCDEGYRSRYRQCVRSRYDSKLMKYVDEIMENQEWLCGNDLTFEDTYQVERCLLAKCRFYSDWTEWSSCNRLCGGYRHRKRDCALNDISLEDGNSLCDYSYLNNVEVCGLNDCSEIATVLYTKPSNMEIIKRGLLRFVNTFNEKMLRIFTQSDSTTELQKIGQIVCSEMGYSGLSKVNSVQANDQLKSEYQDAAYLHYVNVQNLNGLKCLGNEKTIKDCSSLSNSTLTSAVYELDIECIYDGFWTTWSSWSTCSKACGVGALTRTRECNDPKPSISQLSSANGSSCGVLIPGQAETHFETCSIRKCN